MDTTVKSITKCFKFCIGVWILFSGILFAQSTTFEIYPDETSMTPLTEVILSDGGYDINSDVVYVASKIYLDIQPGEGNWYLVIYTHGPFDTWWMPLHEQNHLYALDETQAPLTWKYRNELRFGRENNPIGSVIPQAEWVGDGLKYLYMWNCVNNTADDIDDDALQWASIVHHLNSSQLPSGRLEVSFGVDLRSAWRSAQYGTSLTFEVYYKE